MATAGTRSAESIICMLVAAELEGRGGETAAGFSMKRRSISSKTNRVVVIRKGVHGAGF